MGRNRTSKNQDLPPRLLCRKGRYYYATPGKDRRELPLGADRPTALRRYAEMVETGRSVTAVPECHATRMHKAMRANAKARGIEVKLSLSELEARGSQHSHESVRRGCPVQNRRQPSYEEAFCGTTNLYRNGKCCVTDAK